MAVSVDPLEDVAWLSWWRHEYLSPELPAWEKLASSTYRESAERVESSRLLDWSEANSYPFYLSDQMVVTVRKSFGCWNNTFVFFELIICQFQIYLPSHTFASKWVSKSLRVEVRDQPNTSQIVESDFERFRSFITVFTSSNSGYWHEIIMSTSTTSLLFFFGSCLSSTVGVLASSRQYVVHPCSWRSAIASITWSLQFQPSNLVMGLWELRIYDNFSHGEVRELYINWPGSKLSMRSLSLTPPRFLSYLRVAPYFRRGVPIQLPDHHRSSSQRRASIHTTMSAQWSCFSYPALPCLALSYCMRLYDCKGVICMTSFLIGKGWQMTVQFTCVHPTLCDVHST